MHVTGETTYPWAMSIIVTVPHAVGQSAQHGYDYVAHSVAQELVTLLRQANFHVLYLVGDQGRTETCDLNRKRQCNESSFQTRYFLALASKPVFVLDIHSYPATEPATRASPAYVLFETPVSENVQKLMRTLAVPTFPGAPGVNAIISWATINGIDAVLLEFNELFWSLQKLRIHMVLVQLVEHLVRKHRRS